MIERLGPSNAAPKGGSASTVVRATATVAIAVGMILAAAAPAARAAAALPRAAGSPWRPRSGAARRLDAETEPPAAAPGAPPPPAEVGATPSAPTPAGTTRKAAADPAKTSPSLYDRIWSYATLYDDPDNGWLQQLDFVGREQVDWYHFEGEHHTADNFVDRRTRVGLKAKVLRNVTLHGEVDLNLEGDGGTYSRLTDAYARWSPDKRFSLTVGKQSAKFTLDGSISSTQLLTIDRSDISNNFWFPDEYVPGVSVGGSIGAWSYNAGWFSAGDQDSEFGDFSADSFVLLSAGYDLASVLGMEKAPLRFDYVYQDPDSRNDYTRPLEHVASLNFQAEKGRWGFASDVDHAVGYGSQPDLVGGQIEPSVKFRETWQAVLRYTGIRSDGDNGVRFARYENRVVLGRGDEYNEIYLGLNKYFYGHKLKWQTGLQYSHMDDDAHDGGAFDGWGVTTALRLFW